MAARTSSGTLVGIGIICILFLSMLVRCTPVESAEQMESDIAGLSQEQRDSVVAPKQHELYPGRLP